MTGTEEGREGENRKMDKGADIKLGNKQVYRHKDHLIDSKVDRGVCVYVRVYRRERERLRLTDYGDSNFIFSLGHILAVLTI